MKYYQKCNDCGGDIKEPSLSHRRDVCDTCWDNRGWLLKNHLIIDILEFQKVQRSMVSHRGTTKRRIEKLKSELGGLTS